MKKYAMLAVKGLIGLLPLSLKNSLKKNTKLTELYSRSLQRSGLFYGFPSKKKRMAMYSHYIVKQEAYLSTTYASSIIKNSINIVIFGVDGIADTLSSLSRCKGIENASRILVIADDDNTTELTADCYQADIVKGLVSCKKFLLSGGDTLFINSGDQLHHLAIVALMQAVSTHDAVYCDSDVLTREGSLEEPRFYPGWNSDLHFTTAYVNTGFAVSNAALASFFAKNISIRVTTIAQLVAQLWVSKLVSRIGHIPSTLIHCDISPVKEKEQLTSVAATINHFCDCESSFNTSLKVNQIVWSSDNRPLVSLIIPTKDAWELVKACIDSILSKTTYQQFEILLIDNGSSDPDSLAYFAELNNHPKITVLNYPGPFNYSAINNFGVKHAKGEVIGLINNDIEVISPNWLTYMTGHVLRDDVGCVGAKLLYSDGRIQHAGVVLGYGGGAGHAHKYFPRYHPGYLKRLIATQQYSAVTAACLLVKRSHFETVGGLNETDLTVAFNDVDFCLRIRELGVNNIYCAEAELYHHESISRGLDIAPEKAARFNKELAYLQTNWASVIESDPAYSPNLTLKRENFAIKVKEEYES